VVPNFFHFRVRGKRIFTGTTKLPINTGEASWKRDVLKDYIFIPIFKAQLRETSELKIIISAFGLTF
jgi:hypothetical protein